MPAGAIGQYFDDPDDLFNWANNAVLGLAVIRAANDSGIVQRLLAGPASVAELARLSELPTKPLGRIVDFLVAHELIAAGEDNLLHATKRTELMHEAASFVGMNDFRSAAGAQVVSALREGRTPFEAAFGEPVFAYFASHPEAAAAFSHFMGWMTRRIERFLFTHHPFRPFSKVADIGGSGGDLLLGVLAHYPGTRGILFDLPEVIERARPRVAASAVAERVELVGGSFFAAVPAADLYLLKQILHDWSDDECRTILGHIRRTIAPEGRVAVIDHLLGDVPTPDESQSTDIAMLLWDNGRERKRSEMEALLVASGFRIDRVTPNPSGHSVVEAVPA